MSPPADVTALLLAWNRGDEDARSALMTTVYAELRRMAARRLRGERSGDSLATTALVHETVELRFFGGLSVEETAAALNVSRATVTRDWAFARAWLYRELRGTTR